MPNYTLTYGRTVYLERTIEADDEDGAYKIAHDLEWSGQLGLDDWTAKPGSEVVDIYDAAGIWDITEVYP